MTKEIAPFLQSITKRAARTNGIGFSVVVSQALDGVLKRGFEKAPVEHESTDAGHQLLKI